MTKNVVLLKILTVKVYSYHLACVYMCDWGVFWLLNDSNAYILGVFFQVRCKVARFSFYNISRSLSKNASRPSSVCCS